MWKALEDAITNANLQADDEFNRFANLITEVHTRYFHISYQAKTKADLFEKLKTNIQPQEKREIVLEIT